MHLSRFKTIAICARIFIAAGLPEFVSGDYGREGRPVL
jgi:hypothetical protein